MAWWKSQASWGLELLSIVTHSHSRKSDCLQCGQVTTATEIIPLSPAAVRDKMLSVVLEVKGSIGMGRHNELPKIIMTISILSFSLTRVIDFLPGQKFTMIGF